jgi:predicted metal-binding membrane protein
VVAAPTATPGLAAVSWVVALRQMDATMDMGVTTRLGSFWSFVALWVSMTAAMMLPGAAPAGLGRARADGGRRLGAVSLFVGRTSPSGLPSASPCTRRTGRTERSPPAWW